MKHFFSYTVLCKPSTTFHERVLRYSYVVAKGVTEGDSPKVTLWANKMVESKTELGLLAP